MKTFPITLLKTSEIIFSDGTEATGADGNITVTSGSVKIEEIYENDNVSGVTTKRGPDKGLNYGSGTYDPENGAYIDARDFTVNDTAILIHGTAYGDGSSNKNGIIWIAATGDIAIEGTIDLDELGYSGGAQASEGEGPGYGNDAYNIYHAGGIQTNTYGGSSIPTTIWGNIYGSGGGGGERARITMLGSHGDSGGGGGGAAFANNGSAGQNGVDASNSSIYNGGGPGGNGGGAIRLYATNIDISSGIITANGEDGDNGRNGISSDEHEDAGCGGGGGGAGGTVYIEVEGAATLGTNNITCSKGLKGSGGSGVDGGFDGGDGGDGSVGRIHVEGTYSGSTNDPAIA